MNETCSMLMQRIYETGFAVDDINLYLDTHPTDPEALSYYNYVVQLRKEAMDAYASQCGPLMVDEVNSQSNWTWLDDKWPWEGGMQ